METMTKLDLKKAYRELFSPPRDRFAEVVVPPMSFVKVDGAGDPTSAPDYKIAVKWLYGVSYAIKFAARDVLQRDYVVPPLEALWWADDPAAFTRRDKAHWHWTAMILLPEFITRTLFDRGVAKILAKRTDRPPSLRLESLDESRCLQILHVGSYDDEGPVLKRLHEEVMPAMGVTFNGHHHEIYLSDPRKTDPAKLKTILRQPIRER